MGEPPSRTESSSGETSVLEFTSYRGWQMFWKVLPTFPQVHLLSVDQFGLWREHLAWSKRGGGELRALVIQRLSTNIVFLTLLTSSVIGILFSPSKPMNVVRTHLKNADIQSQDFWTGIFLCLTVFASISALYTSFTAWSIFSVISDENSHVLLRSSIGLYASQLPVRLVSMVIFLFLVTMDLFLFLLVPILAAVTITVAFWLLIIHLTSTYSALGRIIINTGAMGQESVLSNCDAEMMEPYELYVELLKRHDASKQKHKKEHSTVSQRYRIAEALRKTMCDLENNWDEDSTSLNNDI